MPNRALKKQDIRVVQGLLGRRLGETAGELRNRFLEEWLTREEMQENPEFISRGMKLGIDISRPRRMMAVAVYAPSDGGPVCALRDFEAALGYLCRLTALQPGGFFYRGRNCSILGMDACSDERILAAAGDLKKMTEERFRVQVAIGIDNGVGVPFCASRSAFCAEEALGASLRTGRREIRSYDDMTVELLSGELSQKVKAEFIAKIFRGMSREKTAENIHILEEYYRAEGSLQKAADQLYIHKNTLQNKLKSIAQATSYDPRSLKCAALFSIAICFYHEIMGEEKM